MADDLVRTRRGRGRPTSSETDAIVKAILHSAFKQFLTRGFDGAIMDRIAVDAGITRATLYSRFSTKEALFHAVLEDHYRRWEASRCVIPEHSDWRERLRLLAVDITRQFGSDWRRDHDRLMQLGGDKAPDHVRRLYGGYQDLVESVAAEVLRGASGEGSPPRDPEAVAITIITSLLGWRQIEQQVRDISPLEADRFARDLVDRLLEGRHSW